MLTRICLDDPGTVATLQATADAVTELAGLGLMAMIEPFLSVRRGGRVVNLLDPESTIKSISVASALGGSSAHTWLKLPVVDELERVMDATTLPTLLLGGDPQGDPQDTYASWGASLDLPAVRGLVVGRALLYPPDGDVAAAVDIAAELVHGASRWASRWVLPLGSAEREDWAVVVDESVDGWTYTGLYAGSLLPGEERGLSTGTRELIVVPLSGSVDVQCTDSTGTTSRVRARRTVVGVRRARPTWPSSPGAATSSSRRPSPAGWLWPSRWSPTGLWVGCRPSSTSPPPTCPSSCVAPARPPARSATSVSRASSTPRRSSPARSSPPAATGARTRRTSTTPAARASSRSWRRSTTTRSRPPPMLRRAPTRWPTCGSTAPWIARSTSSRRCGQVTSSSFPTAGTARRWRSPATTCTTSTSWRARDPERAWLICDDPAHGWVRDTWTSQAVDPRLPLSSPGGSR